MVTEVEPNRIHFGDSSLEASVILWAAGVAASPLGKMLDAPLDRAGRVLVEADLTVPGHPEVFIVGDMASVKQVDGKPVPGVAPAAIQMGEFAAQTILDEVAGQRNGYGRRIALRLPPQRQRENRRWGPRLAARASTTSIKEASPP